MWFADLSVVLLRFSFALVLAFCVVACSSSVSVTSGELQALDTSRDSDPSRLSPPESCGDGVLDAGETCDPSELCPVECPRMDGCVMPRLTGQPETCNSACVYDPITQCASDDSCCPAGCTKENDNDCFDYYVDATGGLDTNDGRSPATAWKSVSKINATRLVAGESVGFRRGETWRETLVIPSSGTASAWIRFSAYGNGEKPEIRPSQIVTGWARSSGNIWSASANFPVRQVYVDGAFVTAAHHPNNAYTITEGPSGGSTTMLIDNELLIQGADIAGANVVLRTREWEIEEREAVSFSSTTHALIWSPATTYNMRPDWGYYLEGKPWMLDQPGEWFHDAGAGQLYLRLQDDGDPNAHTIEASRIGRGRDTPTAEFECGIRASGRSYFSVSDLSIRHAGEMGVRLLDPVAFRLSYLDVRQSGGGIQPDPRGRDGVGIFVQDQDVDRSGQIRVIENSVVRDHTRGGIQLMWANDVQVLGNEIVNVGTLGRPRNPMSAISIYSVDRARIEGNRLDNSGGRGVSYHGSYNVIKNNLVDRTCMVTQDCAAFYIWNGMRGPSSDPGWTANRVEGNIILRPETSTERLPETRSERGGSISTTARTATPRPEIRSSSQAPRGFISGEVTG